MSKIIDMRNVKDRSHCVKDLLHRHKTHEPRGTGRGRDPAATCRSQPGSPGRSTIWATSPSSMAWWYCGSSASGFTGLALGSRQRNWPGGWSDRASPRGPRQGLPDRRGRPRRTRAAEAPTPRRSALRPSACPARGRRTSMLARRRAYRCTLARSPVRRSQLHAQSPLGQAGCGRVGCRSSALIRATRWSSSWHRSQHPAAASSASRTISASPRNWAAMASRYSFSAGAAGGTGAPAARWRVIAWSRRMRDAPSQRRARFASWKARSTAVR